MVINCGNTLRISFVNPDLEFLTDCNLSCFIAHDIYTRISDTVLEKFTGGDLL